MLFRRVLASCVAIWLLSSVAGFARRSSLAVHSALSFSSASKQSPVGSSASSQHALPRKQSSDGRHSRERGADCRVAKLRRKHALSIEETKVLREETKVSSESAKRDTPAVPVRLLGNLEIFSTPQEVGSVSSASVRRKAFPNRDGEARDTETPDCSPKIPAENFRPKQSLGQSFLVDEGVCRKIVQMFHREVVGAERRLSEKSHVLSRAKKRSAVVEVGPGTGALTRWLFPLFPDMLAVEIDPKCISLLSQRLPSLHILHEDVLQLDFPHLARSAGRLQVIGNLPFYLTSQLLCCMLDCRQFVDLAVLTLQKELAERLVARPGEAAYSRLSVLFALYAEVSLLFDIPSHVFYPPPKVTAGVVRIRFSSEPDATILDGVDPKDLKKVLFAAFGQRRKMLRQSLKSVLPAGVEVPPLYASLRPQALPPEQFVRLTASLFGRRLLQRREEEAARDDTKTNAAESPPAELEEEPPHGDPPRVAPPVWRKAKHGFY